MTNENKNEKVIKLAFLPRRELAEMICSKDEEIVRLNNILSDLEAQMQDQKNMGYSDRSDEIQRLNNLIDTLKQGNQKLINTVAYQAMQLAGELKP